MKNDPSQTLLTLINHVIRQHPEHAKQIENVAQKLQGKGYGAASIQQENSVVHSLLGREPTIAIDIGGNIGEYTAELRRRNPRLEIHTFEPSHTNIQKLNARFGNDALIKVIPYGVSNNNGSATLFSNEAGSGLASLSQRKLEHFGIKFNLAETINTVRFEDYWMGNLNHRLLDIVKLDIEGHELSALEGFGKSLAAISVIQFEFGGCNIDTRTYFQDFWYFFKENDFSIYRITPFGAEQIESYTESEECFSTTNYVAARKVR
jgi:FkbM family methyltransferase